MLSGAAAHYRVGNMANYFDYADANPAKGPVRAHNVAEPVSYAQGKSIGMSIGGMAAACGNPDLEKAVRDGKLSHADVLTQMGLNRGTASVVIQGLSEMGLLTPNFGPENAAKAQQAQAVLFQVGGVSCLAKHLGGAAPAAARPYVPYVPKNAVTKHVSKTKNKNAWTTTTPPIELKLAYRAAHGPKWFENDTIYAAYRAGTPPVAKRNPQSPWPRTVGKKPLWHLQSVENGVATYQAKAGFTFPGDAPGVYSTTIGESEPGLWYRKSSNGYSEFFSKAEALQDLADA